MITTVIEKLQAVQAKRQYARIARSGVSRSADYHFVLDRGPSLVLLQDESSFRLDGYSIVNLADVTAVRSGRLERFTERLLKQEEIRPAPPPVSIDLADWRSVLKSLQAYGKHVIIECETGDEDLDEFFIGRIEKLNKVSLAFRHFDALGQWDDEPTTIRFRDITRVRFDERYIDVYSRSLRSALF